MGWLDDINADAKQQQLDDQRRLAEQQRKQASQSQAKLVADLKKQYPWLTPGAAMSLAKAGHAADSRQAREVARRAAERKKKKGIGWHSIGDVVGAVGDFVMPEKAEDVIGNAVLGGKKLAPEGARLAKGAVRAGFTALQAGSEVAQSAVRMEARRQADLRSKGFNAGAANVFDQDARRREAAQSAQELAGEGEGIRYGSGLNPLEATTAWQAGKRLLDDDPKTNVDLGTGFFPGGGALKRQQEVAREQASIPDPSKPGGRSAGTFGRLTAYQFTEPGTTAFNWTSGIIDAAYVLKADPGDRGLSELGRINQGRKLIDPSIAGGIANATRRTAITEQAVAYLRGPDGRKFLDWAAGESSPYKIFKAMGGKISADEAADLARFRNVDDIADYIEPKLGTSIREKPYVANALTRAAKPVDGFSSLIPEKITKRLDGVRLTHVMPGRHVNPNDPTDVAQNMARAAFNAKLGADKAEEYFNLAANARGPIGQFNAVNKVQADIARTLLDKGTGDKVARGLTTMYRDYMQEAAKYYTDDIGNNVPVLGAVIRGENFALPTPHLWTEYVNGAIPLPDARAIRRATSKYGRVLNHLALEGAKRPVPTAVLDFVFQDAWKPMQLIRGAWTVRVVGEEQIRMSMVGLNSVINHPIHAIAWAVGSDTRRGRALHKLGIADRGSTDLLGRAFGTADDAVAADASDFARALTHRGEQWRDRVGMIGQVNVQRGAKGYADALADELAKLRNDPITQRVAGGLKAGDLMPMPKTGNPVDDVKNWFWSGTGRKFRMDMAEASGRQELLTSRQVADELIDSYWQRIQTKTAGSVELREVISTGKLRGVDVFVKGKKGLQPSAEFSKFIDDLAVEGGGPSTAVAQLRRSMAGGAASDIGLDRAVDHLFNTFMSRPTNFLSRSPAFRQFYWKRVEELLPGLDDTAKAKVLEQARDAKLDGATLSRMNRTVAAGNGNLDVKDIDVLAKAYGLESTKKLLYDLTNRSQFFDITRHIFPFGEAWAEVMKVWGGVIADNPQVIRRAQLAIQGARGSGFFHPDEHGEEVFHYPGTGFLTKQIAGVPAPFTGRVQGLNIFSENPLVPGFGPMVQIASSYLLPKKSSWDGVRDLIAPFGDPEIKGGALESFFPPWFQKFRQADKTPFGRQDDRLWMNTWMEAARYLRNSNPDWDDEKLTEEATKSANRLYVLRGAAQFFAPSAPSPKFQAHDKEGNLTTAFKLVEAYRKLQEADRKNNTDTAVETFLATYGPDALLYMQNKSEGGGPMTTEGLKWVKDNQDFVKRYPLTYALFAPQGEGFNYDAYMRLIKNGEVRPLSQNEFLANANNRVAAMIYRQAQKAVGDKVSEREQEWLREVKSELRTQYPGYDTLQPKQKRVAERQIEELGKAVKELDTPLAKSIAKYLTARDRAQAAAEKKGLASFGTAKKAQSLRAWLRDVAFEIGDDNPEFNEVFDRVFSRELADDEEDN